MKIELEFKSALSSPPEVTGVYLYWNTGTGFISDIQYSAEHKGWNLNGDNRSYELRPDDTTLWAVLDNPREAK